MAADGLLETLREQAQQRNIEASYPGSSEPGGHHNANAKESQ